MTEPNHFILLADALRAAPRMATPKRLDIGEMLAKLKAEREARDAGLPHCMHGHKHYCGHCGKIEVKS